MSDKWQWAPRGVTAFEIWSPDRQLVAIVGGPQEARLNFYLERKDRPELEAFANEIIEGREANEAWAMLIVDALNSHKRPIMNGWLPVLGYQSTKACPRCGEVALEGETECNVCHESPTDDTTWRKIRASLTTTTEDK